MATGLALVILASALKLWMVSGQALQALGEAYYDDRWFLQRAITIMEGRWLGDYNELTLIKGPMYPLWLAFIASQGVPLLLAQHVLYALACLAVSRALAPAFPSAVLRAFLFIVLLFNPMSYGDDIATRVSREGIYPALGLFVFAGVAGATLRLGDKRRSPLSWSMLSGVAIAIFWNTREEGAWILPLLGFSMLALSLWMLRATTERWRQAVALVALPVLIVIATHTTIVLINGARYDMFDVVEFKNRSFLSAYGSLAHVRQHPSRPRIPVPRETRARIYAVSPAFAELRPHLEGSLAENWKRGGDEIPGESFMWVFRGAVGKEGYYARGGRAVKAYYDRISREIEEARVAGRLDARRARASLVPPLLKGQRREVLWVWLKGLVRVLRFSDAWVTLRFSQGSDAELQEFAELTRSRLAPRQKLNGRARVTGWVLHVNGSLDLALEKDNGRPVPEGQVRRLPSPDVYEHLKTTWKEFPPARHCRFEIESPTEGVVLALRLSGKVVERIRMDLPLRSVHPNVRLSIDQVTYEQLRDIPAPLEPRVDALNGITRVYQRLVPTLFILAFVLYGLNLRWLARRRDGWTLPLLVAGLVSAVAARILIMALIDVTSFPVFMAAYISPSHALVLVAGVVAAFDAVAAVWIRLSGRA